MTEKKEEKGEEPAVGRQRAVILNFWWSLNYGAILTAYALQRELEKLGVDNRLVNFLHEWCREPFKNSFSEKFAERYLKVTPPFESVADLVELNRTADVFIVGSDQVFRLSYNAGYEFYYYLPFVDADKKKIACAASFGASELEGTIADRELVRCYLSGFDAVSVRETDGLRLCGEELRRSDAVLILDPVFWPAPGEWETLIRNADDGEKDFGLTYVLDQNKETDAVAAAAEHRFAVGKVIDMGNAQKDGEITLSPEQWLYNIKNCRYMVTDSFHVQSPGLPGENCAGFRSAVYSFFQLFKIQEDELALFSPPMPNSSETLQFLQTSVSGMLSRVRSPPLAKISSASGNCSRTRRMPSPAELSSSLKASTLVTFFRFSQMVLRVWKFIKFLPFLRHSHSSELSSRMTPSLRHAASLIMAMCPS